MEHGQVTRHADPPPRRGGSPAHPDSSQLCLECGLCCRGVLHRSAILRDDEVPRAGRQRLDLVTSPEDGPVRFSLPCAAFGDGGCSIYDERPLCCREYECRVFRRFVSGSLDADGAIARIRRAQALVARLERRLGSPNGFSWDDLVRGLPELTPDDRDAVDGNDARLDAGEVLIFLRREFL